LMYLAALEKNIITPSTVLHDKPTTFKRPYDTDPKGYTPKNYDGKFRGQLLPRRALANSLNVPSVEIMFKLGVPAGLDMAHRLGITTLKDPNNYGPSLVLGAGNVPLIEMTNAYSTFANQGMRSDPNLILQIKDKDNNEVYSYHPSPKKVVESGLSYIITSFLSDKNARKEIFGSVLDNAVNAAVKTGTTDNYVDALTMGYTPNVVIGVWVGNNDNKPMDQIAGSLGAAPIFTKLVEKFSPLMGNDKFTVPTGIVEKYICASNGLLVKESTSSAYKEVYIKGTEPTRYCTVSPPSSSPQPGQPNSTPQPNTQPQQVQGAQKTPVPQQNDNQKRKNKKD
jgi:membrane peptidoglycan carboxypeptidase